jgi:hypothetical protein
MRDLGVGEAERRHAGGSVRLVALAISRLLRRRAVVSQPVGLDDQAELGPVEVDPEAVDAASRAGPGKARPTRYRQEAPLELGVGEREGAAVEEPSKRRDPAATGHPVERRPEPLGIHEPAPVGFVDRGLERARRQPGGEVDQGDDGPRNGDAPMAGDLVGAEAGASVDADASDAASLGCGDRDLDLGPGLGKEAPERAGGAVAERGVGPPASTAAIQLPYRVSWGRPTA